MIRLLNMRRAWLLALLVTTAVSVRPEAQGRGGQRPGAPPDGPPSRWTGTIHLVRQGDDTIVPDGGGSFKIRARLEATWSVRADGSAHYEVKYEDVSVVTDIDGNTISCHSSGAGTGESMAGVELAEIGPGTVAAAMLGSGTWALAAGSAHFKATSECDAAGFVLTEAWVGGIGDDEVAARSREPRTATHLAGSQKGTIGLRAPPRGQFLFAYMLPLEQTIDWDLSRGPVSPTPTVTIYGSPCHCFDDAEESGASLHFFAATAVSGGTLSAFEVTADGEMPEIDTNEDGQLDLTATPTTGAVTLKVHYTKDGRRYDATPFTVHFCDVKAIELADGEHDLSFDDESQLLKVSAKTTARFNGRDANGDIAWDIEKMGAPTQLTSSPDPARGATVTWTYSKLPTKNSDFGPKKISAEVKRGACACQRHEQVRAFFVDDGGYNPFPTTVPNWFYYWQQTRAVDGVARPLLQYMAVIPAINDPDNKVLARWDFPSQRLLLSAMINTDTDGCRGMVESTGPYPRQRTSRDIALGIDCFAETIRHEMQHRKEATDWWGSPRGFSDVGPVDRLIRDRDLDGVPDEIEQGLPGCRTDGPKPNMSCLGRPFEDATDLEVNAYWVGWSWKLGSVDKEDWSCGPASKQWHGSRCQ